MSGDQGRRTLIVTGATSGMGRAIALRAARAGWATIATVRDPERARALEFDAKEQRLELDIRYLDITDHPAVTEVVEAVGRDYGHIDAVVSQAGGIFALGTAEQIPMAGFRATMENNFFGNLAVIRAVLPHLRASRGRLITTTSANGAIAAPYNDAYAASKFALEGVMEGVAPLLARFGVKATILEPGPIATDVMAPRRRERLIAPVPVPDDPYVDPWVFLERVIAHTGAVQPAEDVARQVLELLDAEAPPLRAQTSPWTTEFVTPKLADADGSRAFTALEDYLRLGD
ncbi:oxidoreductase [Rugosimonospora acidiphila]|uniref:Oxidoreductase n=1 Tax=Rugosimonospora acidiphila TaxID=556531 RepID=A0ABP9SKF1_9ACTN